MNLPPIPVPAFNHFYHPAHDAPDYRQCVAYTESQLKGYGAACYAAAIEEAAMRCMDYMEDTYGSTFGVGECIRALLKGEK